ncbi:MAG TPA: DUF4160 domain-containing protein [Thermoanaerobaculia bacterium]|nr:DUF4160 domain-containing protein [Thermoanaerobaculia bacterium]
MPEVSRFFGIVITMHFADHPPPHFHVRYGSFKALVAVEQPSLLEGRLPPRALGLVVEWATLHREELLANWTRAREQRDLNPIAPLE